MAITPVQPNIDNTKLPYREAKGVIKTDSDIKPLPPQGHLVHDTLLSVPQYFLKDIAYDIKAVKDGFQGKANDHQLGRLNDVGLKVGGIGIATYLASRTTNPMARTMEYLGLGAFLTSMSLFPKAFINVPSRITHGFSVGKEYIDDQGRKKSVFQDSNYIPMDMYRGEFPGEDLDVIGDRMGIPRGIKNRNDLIKEQMRKVATQDNTLWMLTAGFATPVMTALICCGLEKVIAPAMEKARNMRYDSKISHLARETAGMTLKADEIPANKLSKEVGKILNNYKGQELPKAELDNLVEMLSKNLDSKVSEGIKEDLTNMFEKSGKSYAVNDKTAEEIVANIKNSIPNRNKATLEKVFVPTKEEISKILGDSKEISQDRLYQIKGELKKLFAEKIAQETGMQKSYLKAYENTVIENISKSIQKNPSRLVKENQIKSVENFAKVIGEFKANNKALDKCKNFKVEHAPQTVLAHEYAKFESALLDILGFKHKDLKQMRQSDELTKEFLDKKLTELTKNEEAYNKAISKLSKVMAEMDHTLNGNKDALKDLITGVENNFNNTAKRLDGLGSFKNTIDKLVKEDVKTLSNSINSKEELFDLLDGLAKNTVDGKTGVERAKEFAKGVGSAKHDVISRIIDRYQGVNNSFNRILHTMDMYKRGIPADKYGQDLVKMGKDALLGATSANQTLKLNTVNNPELYKDIVQTTWRIDGNPNELKAKGYITEATDKAIGNASIKERLQHYIGRFKNVVGNNTIDFTKPEHNFNVDILKGYQKGSKTRMATFNLVAQNPVEFVKNAAERRYGNQKWARTAGAIFGTVAAVTIAAQLCFGKIRNPHNIEKKVEDGSNN